MNFDTWWNWDEEPRQTDTSHTQRLPDGTHTGDIVHAEIKDLSFKVTDDNASGTSLVVRWSRHGYYPVEAIAPVTWRGMIEAICRAAGVAPPQRGQEWDERSLIGQVATIDIENAVSKAGKEFQKVTRWHASPRKPVAAEPAKKRAPARTPAAKANAEFKERADADDIPF